MAGKSFKLGYLTHMSSTNVDVMCNQADEDRELITDECAATVASFFQSPGIGGRAFAALASGAEWTLEEMVSDIAYAEAHDIPPMYPPDAARSYLQMRMLKAWLAHKAGLWVVTVYFKDGTSSSGLALFYELQDEISGLTLLKYEDPTSDLPLGDGVDHIEIR